MISTGLDEQTLHPSPDLVREAMREAKDIQLGDPDTTVEIDETYIGGQLRHKGSKVAHASIL